MKLTNFFRFFIFSLMLFQNASSEIVVVDGIDSGNLHTNHLDIDDWSLLARPSGVDLVLTRISGDGKISGFFSFTSSSATFFTSGTDLFLSSFINQQSADYVRNSSFRSGADFGLNYVRLDLDGNGVYETVVEIDFGTITPLPDDRFTRYAYDSEGGDLDIAAALDAMNNPPSSPMEAEILVERTSGAILTTGQTIIDFGSNSVGSIGGSESFVVRNIGLSALTDFSISIVGPDSNDFNIVNKMDLEGSLAFNEEGRFSVTWIPSASGVSNATLQIVSNDADESPFVIELVGSPVIPLDIAMDAYLKSSSNGVADNFGHAVAISGDTVVVSAPFDFPSLGAIYVFIRGVDGDWTQQACLKASNSGINDLFGYSVAISGDLIVVGAPSEDSSSTGINGDGNNDGAVRSGAAYVFSRTGGSWSQEAYLKASNSEVSDWFGTSVSISEDTIVVGACCEDSAAIIVNGNQGDNSAFESGAAYVFRRNEGSWHQEAYLKAFNTETGDGFGSSVTISGNTIAVGATGESSSTIGIDGNQSDNSANLAGAVYVYERENSVWTQQAYLKASNTDEGDRFGYSVSLSGEALVVGAPIEQSGAQRVNGDETDNDTPNVGAAYVFSRLGSSWSQEGYLKASNAEREDSFGVSVSISGDLVVVGANREESSAVGVDGQERDNQARFAGAGYVFRRSSFGWIQTNYLKASNAEAEDEFGFSIGISNQTVVIGAPFEDSIASGVNGDELSNASPNSGSSYVFEIEATLEMILSAEFANAGLTGEDAELMATPFDDGVPNLLKYAFNLNLSGPDSSTLESGGSSGLPRESLVEIDGEMFFRVEFLRRKQSGLVYTPMMSTTLEQGSFSVMTAPMTIQSIDSEWERVVIDEPFDFTSNDSCFSRVSITIP